MVVYFAVHISTTTNDSRDNFVCLFLLHFKIDLLFYLVFFFLSVDTTLAMMWYFIRFVQLKWVLLIDRTLRQLSYDRRRCFRRFRNAICIDLK